MKTIFSILFSCVAALTLHAQVETDKPIVLTGADGERYITGLELPNANADAANKEYVDAAVSASGGGGAILPTLGTGSLPTKMSAFSPTGGHTWLTASNYCRNLEEGGYTDWRMPTLVELMYFLNNDEAYAGITNPSDNMYFSLFSTSSTQGATGRFYANIATGEFSAISMTDNNSLWRARCVR